MSYIWFHSISRTYCKTSAINNKSTRRAQTFANGAQSGSLPVYFSSPNSDQDHSQNLITCSLSHLGHILKISSKSVHNFLSYLNYISWIRKIQIVIQFTPKIESFLPFQTYPENFIKIRSYVFELSCSQTKSQTNPGKNIISLAEVTSPTGNLIQPTPLQLQYLPDNGGLSVIHSPRQIKDWDGIFYF